MRAHARVVVEHHRGRNRCTTLRSAPPLTFRETAGGLHLVGTAAGPVGGDELALDVIVGAGAALAVRTVAAQLVLPGTGAVPSTMAHTIVVGPEAVLCWRPEPTVVVRGADHRAATTIDLGPDAELVWRDEVVLGRDGEESGSLLQRLRVVRAGRPLLCTETAFGPAWPTAAGPAGTGPAHVVATTLLVGARARAALARLAGDRSDGGEVRWAAYPLADDVVLLSALGSRLADVRSRLGALAAPDPQRQGPGPARPPLRVGAGAVGRTAATGRSR